MFGYKRHRDLLKIIGALVEASNHNAIYVGNRIKQMADELARVRAAVARATSVQQGAITLLTELVEKIRNLPNDDTEAAGALADELEASTSALAAAIAQDTDADGEDTTSEPDDGDDLPIEGEEGEDSQVGEDTQGG